MGKERELSDLLLQTPETKKIVFGVTHALITFTKQLAQPLKNTVIIETGGMKGKMKEITRARSA